MKRIIGLILCMVIIVGISVCTNLSENVDLSKKLLISNETVRLETEVKQEHQKKEVTVWNVETVIKEKKKLGTCYAYPSEDKKTCWLIKYKLKKGKDIETIKIPNYVKGMRVIQVEPESRSSYIDNIFGVDVWHDGDLYLKKTKKGIRAFGIKSEADKVKELLKIKKVVFGNNTEIIGRECLAGLPNLKEIVLPKNLKKIDIQTFNYTRNIQHIEFPQENENFVMQDGMLINKKDNLIVFMMTDRERVEIPPQIKELSYFYIRKGIKTIYIPDTVEELDNYLYPIQPVIIKVSPTHPKYASNGTCVYEKETGYLTIITIQNKTLSVEEGVKFIGGTKDCELLGHDDYDFFPPVNKIIYSKTVKKVYPNWAHLNLQYVEEISEGEKPEISREC